MKLIKVITICLCLAMIASMFAGCSNDKEITSSIDSSQGVNGNDQYIDAVTGEITNIGSPTTMKITPEEVGKISNPVVRGLEAWMSDSRLETTIALREQAYGLKYDYEECDQTQRTAKWISAYVAGDAYDVLWLTAGDFPVVAQQGLIQPLDKILPVYDPKYFNQAVTEGFTWKGRVYGANDAQSGIDTYGIFYNKSILENAGETLPIEYYENGTWTFEQFENLAKRMHNVTGSADDIYGFAGSYAYLTQCSVVSNGGYIVKYTDTGADVTLTDPKTMQALEWTGRVRNYHHATGGRNYFLEGKSALYMERISQINSIRMNSPDYEFGWVPFPKGPSGEGKQGGNAYAWAIGKGAKNIEGALVWISAGNYMETWMEQNGIVTPNDTMTEEEKALGEEASANAKMNNYEGFGLKLWAYLEEAKITGFAAATEKYLPEFQAQVDDVLGVKAEVGAIEFEDQGLFNFDDQEADYPFVNVIGDDKFAWGTMENPSLKVDLTNMTDFGAILHTKPELFKLQNGGQYKVTFKLLCDKAPASESFAVAARTTAALEGDPTFGMTWISPKGGSVYEVEAYINVDKNFSGDLAIVLLGSASGECTNILIDDFRVELVENN